MQHIFVQFNSRKFGDFETSQIYRENLGQEIDNLQSSLKETNKLNRPPSPPQVVFIQGNSGSSFSSGYTPGGATTGAIIGSTFGPVGALFGSAMGGITDIFRK